jgi:putative ABC transport system substrate-binding protein
VSSGESREKHMKEKIRVLTLCAMLLALCSSVDAQQTGKVPRIGLLIPTSPSFYAARIKAFQQGLHEHGYVEGKNIMLEYRYAEGKVDRYPELATELVGLKVDVIVTASEPAVQAAKKASSTIPLCSLLLPIRLGVGLSPASLGQGVTRQG